MSYNPPATQGTNTLAILSLVCAFVFWPLGIVFGHMAKGQIRRTGEGGGGLATAGLILSYLALAITVISVVFLVLAVAAAGAAGAS